MIFTCTLNPSLDYYLESDKNLTPGKMNRSQLEYYEAGGKGINVSIVLNNLGIPSRALGFLGGFTKDFYISLLAKYEYILPHFTYINGPTRINIKMRTADGPTDINAAGPYITPEDMNNLENKAERLSKGDYLVLAGNTPVYLAEDVKVMLKKAIEQEVKVCLDTDPGLIRDMLGNGLFLIKTTPEELSVMVDRKIENEEDCIAAIRELHEGGAENAIVVYDNKKAFISCNAGTFEAMLQEGIEAVNTVGTGDSLVAGFLMNYLRSKDPVDSFHFGASCGSATAYSRTLATREKIDSFYEEKEVREIPEAA